VVFEATKLADLPLGLEVRYVGQTGPRCVPGGAGCSPYPYLESSNDPRPLRTGEFALPYDPALPRGTVTHSGAETLGGACHHDGECGPCGGRNTYAAWYLAGPPGGSHVLHTEMFDDYCGCVRERCAWFTPQRRAFVLQSRLSVKGWGEPRTRDRSLRTAARML
jgi:hypothetical protein